MTAYGRASVNTKVGHFVVEIQSVNRKFLDVHVSLPRELNQFDIELKKWIMPYVARGQVSIKVDISFEGAVPFIIRSNLPLAKQLKQAWYEIAEELEMPKESFCLSFITGVEGLLTFEENKNEEDNYRLALKETFELALQSFMEMKKQEGAVLQQDFSERLKIIAESIEHIEARKPFATQKYRDKLIARLNEILPGQIENDERILKEIALFAEKIDINEEMVRLKCHLKHFTELFETEELSVGKTFEFILQELNREVNTIGSKSSDLEISRAVIDIKGELERIREQIQNIE